MKETFNFLFWNVDSNLKKEKKNKTDIYNAIKEIVDQKDIHFVLLAETQNLDSNELLGLLKSVKSEFRGRNNNENIYNKRFLIFDTIKKDNIEINTIESEKRMISLVYKINCTDFILNIVHLRDQYNYNKEDLNGYARQHMTCIKQVEIENNTKNSIVVGDFNLDPYDDGLLYADAFNAIMSKNTVLKSSKRKYGNEYFEFFYNPGWSLLGKEDVNGVAGTFRYRNTGKIKVPIWHVLDQVILRKSLIKNYVNDSLSIITSVNGHNFIKSDGRPNYIKYSDHLPIEFKMKF